MPPSFASRAKLASIVVFICTMLVSTVARADNVDRLMKQLGTSSDYKVRLSAALGLAKLRDQRSVPAFVKALHDSDKTVRGVAAASLGKVVNSSTKAKLRSKVLAALKTSMTNDNNSFVRKQAEKAYKKLAALGSGGGGTSRVSTGGTYVNIGPMSNKAGGSDKIRAHMRKTVLKTFAKKANKMATAWPGGKNPSRKQLAAKKMKAFHVDGTLNELKATPRGSSTVVSCKVSMLLASYPEKSMFGFLKGGAQVQSSSSAKEVEYAKEDCVSAVMEDLIARKIIPTIRSR
jgi:hypothetical protein